VIHTYVTIITNILVNERKKLQTNIVVNDPYVTRLCGSNTV